MKKLIFPLIIVIFSIFFIYSANASTIPAFGDIEQGCWYEEYAEYCYKYGYINGTENGVFSPETTLSRAMAVKIFYSMSNADTEGLENPFNDVEKDSWYYNSVIWAYNSGLTKGTGTGIFSPNDLITRQDLITMAFNYYISVFHDNSAMPIKSDINVYTDSKDIAEYAKEGIQWALNYGIINGYTDNTLKPYDNITRSQTVKIITILEQKFIHNWYTVENNEKTCVTGGNAKYRCFLCNETKAVSYKPYHIYSKGTITKEPTCGIEGETTYNCLGCDSCYTTIIPPTGDHVYGPWTITAEATKQSCGTRSRVCNGCSYSVNGIYRHDSYYQITNEISIPSGGYNVSTENIGLKVIYINKALLGTSSASYTVQTRNAVAKFQRSNGLPQTGIVDLTTWLYLGYSEYDWYNLAAYITPKRVDVFSSRQEYIDAMLSVAREYANAGTIYRIGCSGTPGTYADCSGLIYQCLYAAGINPDTNIIDHGLAVYEYTSYYLANDPKLGLSVSLNDLEPGDLVFYALNGRSNVCHVGIYAGNGMIYDAWPYIGTTYRSKYISGYHMVKAIRVFP
ncbi:MAG: S-layer homology domain-containing protein [Clostridia bacterium]|nr:S-layer homology domain-containing protein [Clostridia bacterium]